MCVGWVVLEVLLGCGLCCHAAGLVGVHLRSSSRIVALSAFILDVYVRRWLSLIAWPATLR